MTVTSTGVTSSGATGTGGGRSRCGDGNVDPGEECDDGNAVDGDGCSSTCQREVPSAKCGDKNVDPGESCDDGNAVPGDGCESDCTKTPGRSITCQVLAPLESGTCSVTPGDSRKLVLGTVLAPDRVYRGGGVLVDTTGQILCVGCDCAAKASGATRITCPAGVITPALINTHDHITYTQNSPYPDTGERYEHRHDWRKGKNGHTVIRSTGGASVDELAWGELRFLMGGATSIVGSGSSAGLLRNLDKAAGEEELSQAPVDFQTFPLGDEDGTELASGCGYPMIIDQTSIAGEDAFFPHVAEGINAFAENEFACMSSSMNGGEALLQKQSAFIHAIGLRASDYAAMAKAGTSLVWSPRSNVMLYGDTANVREAAALGVPITLGTDWILTGSMNLLRELRCADSLSAGYFDAAFSDEDLWKMVTSSAAMATATASVIGTLTAGKVADISVFAGAKHADYRAIIDADPEDVILVMRGGRLLYGDANVIGAVPGSGACDALDVCGTAKELCLQGEIGKSYVALSNAVGSIYPAFFCDGPPMNEPSCIPARPVSVMGSTTYTGIASTADSDGDGIADSLDDCPKVFNPIRPLDNGAQADFDADGVGDACDVCPFDANMIACSRIDPSDADGDKVPNPIDNCPRSANPDQKDGDADGKGDACDPCPAVANPGAMACPFTIHDVKTGKVPVGTAVALGSAVVTAVTPKGFFLQVKAGDPTYAGSDDSAVFVYQPSPPVKAGDRVSITNGTVTNHQGEIQITMDTLRVDASLGEAPPDPVLVASRDIATMGAKARALEGVLVRIQDATVTDVMPAPGALDATPTNEFVVDGVLRVDDLLFGFDPLPQISSNFASITGILVFMNANSKLEPRDAGDAVAGTPALVGFAPPSAFAEVGQAAAPTLPSALVASLALATGSDTFVAIASSDPASLTVTGGGVTIPAGQLSAAVHVNGLSRSAGVILSARLGATSLMASVRVLDPTEQPAIAAISPASGTLSPGGKETLEVELDIPAPAGGTMVALTVAPANAGSLPATLIVPAGETRAAFDYVDESSAPSATITATLGAGARTAAIAIRAQAGGLILNEVDYDNIGTDSNEFVEILNAGFADVDLTDYALVLVNGMKNEPYLTVPLGSAGSLAADQYLVVASSAVVVPGAARKIPFAAAVNNLQNGAPDGIALVNTATKTLVDALSYEGSIQMADIAELGTVSLVEEPALPASVADSNVVQGSLCRLPNGSDTNAAAIDWAFSKTPTPGAANVP